MFNNLILFIFATFLICESYKYSILKNYNTINGIVINKHTTSTPIQLAIFHWFILTSIYFKFSQTTATLYLIFSILLLFFLFKKIVPVFYVHIFFLLSFHTSIILTSNDLLTLVLNAELISLITFFFLFFNRTSHKHFYKTSAFYFIVNNIVTFLFGLLTLLIILTCCGTSNVDVVFHYFLLSNSSVTKIVLLLYFFCKLGQGPIIFLKFKFYRHSNLFYLFLYVSSYVVLIWPFLLVIIVRLIPTIDITATHIIAFIITYFLLQSLVFNKSFVDFIVFSTWSFVWYQLFYLLFTC